MTLYFEKKPIFPFPAHPRTRSERGNPLLPARIRPVVSPGRLKPLRSCRCEFHVVLRYENESLAVDEDLAAGEREEPRLRLVRQEVELGLPRWQSLVTQLECPIPWDLKAGCGVIG